jgi:hypothetical protein
MRRDQADPVLLILLRRIELRSKTNPTFTPPVSMAVQSRMALRASYRQTPSNRTAREVGFWQVQGRSFAKRRFGNFSFIVHAKGLSAKGEVDVD